MTQQAIFWRRSALTVAIVAAVALAACSKKEEPVTSVAPTAATGAAAAAAVSTDAELRTKAQTAEREQRLYAPAGDNAIEYYLALRERQPNDTLVNNALTDLFPYAMTATEQNLQKAGTATDPNQAQTYRTEAARVFALLERVDKNAPSLPRLRDTMQKVASSELKTQQDEAKKAQDLLTKQTEAAKTAAAAAAAKTAAGTPPTTAVPPPIISQPVQQPVVTRPAPPPQQVNPQPTQTQAAVEPPAPKPARPAAGGLPSVISSAQPEYPREALRDSVSGEVTVSFTVNSDGSVSNANVVSANPRNVFDRAALAAIRKWRFEPPGEAVTGRRTFSFTPGQ